MPRAHNRSSFVYSHSEELTMLLSRPPSAMLRWGILWLALVLLGLIIVSALVPWPDKLSGQITLASDVPPVVITTPSEGYVGTLLVSDGDTVKRGDLLAVMENTAVLADIQALAQWADSLQRQPDVALLEEAEWAVTFMQLGELQSEWEAFLMRAKGLDRTAPLSDVASLQEIAQRIKSAEKQLDRLKKELRELQLEKKASEREFERIQRLYSQGLTTLTALRQAKDEVWAIDKRISQKQAQISTQQDEVARLEVKKRSFVQNVQQTQQDHAQSLVEAASQLKQTIRAWQRAHLIYAPTAGLISFYQNSDLKRRLPEGQELLAIIPLLDTTRVVGRMHVSPFGAARLEQGQQVLVSLYQYPAVEFGRLQGQVASSSLLPQNDGTYLVEVVFPNGLRTDKGYSITYQPQLSGQAEVIIRIQPLLAHLLKR